MEEGNKPHHPIIYMIGNAHIDPVWLWVREEGIAEVLDTARSAVELMRENRDLTFTFAQAQSYVWIEEKDPDLFLAIKQLVAEGRWHIVGGMWVQPDCNMPNGEAFTRHLLYSQRYFQSRFGKQAVVGYNVDSFGHAGTLPQLLNKGGLSSYVFFRPDPQKEVTLDEDLCHWEALDGTRLLAYRPPNHYCTWAGDIEAWIANAITHAPERVGASVCFFGVGNHGGGPTRENIASIRRIAARDDLSPVIFGSLEDFFSQAERARSDYAVRRNDLQHHAPGCYSVHSGIKRWNRKAEQMLVATEKANAVLSMLSPEVLAGTMAFREAWLPILFNQFHDILAGTSIAEAYVEAQEDFAEVTRMADGIRDVVLGRLAESSDCRGTGQAIFFFNPCSWPISRVVELNAPNAKAATVDSELLQSQISHDGQLMAQVDLPALGGVCIHVLETKMEQEAQGQSALVAEESAIENAFWRIEFDPASGDWRSLYDKEHDIEVLAKSGNRLVVLDDPSDTWSHGIKGYHTAIGSFSGAQLEVIERGPLRVSMRVKRHFGRSLLMERVSLYAGDRVIEVSSSLDWHDTRKVLKASFPLAIAYPVCTYEAPYGYTVRVANGEEEPGQTWVDATGVAIREDKPPLPYGLSLVNESKYAFDMKAHGGYSDPQAWVDLRMTILRSPPFAFHDPRPFDPDETYMFVDQGQQEFTYWLLPHRGTWRDAAVPRIAHEKNAPLLSRFTQPYAGGLPSIWSFAESGDPAVELSALKLAEDGSGLIVRLHEMYGEDRKTVMKFPLWNCHLRVPLRHNEVKTLKIVRIQDSIAVDEVNLLEQAMTGGFQATVNIG